ncbi:MAG TPA: glycoside hydrolase family 2 TIM barrel-domain containing protein, partial [Candidatus Limnocylindrales bacterium]|nr:glycoside hydrolase family 2 TIM barrel-domain containing protein [Candidatus Limnocylindrales bacterium]
MAIGACVPRSDPGDLRPTLELVDTSGGRIAVQNGIPVPTFELQPRPRIDLSGPWRVDRRPLDSDLSLTPRDVALPGIVAEAAGRERPDYDDSGWPVVDVPGALNPPPDRTETGGWYRTRFRVPPGWGTMAVDLKFGAVNYLADVWLNGVWLGYHEGGTTPFAFDASRALRPGEENVLAVRVDNPPWGSRNDILPWGLADWWNFAGLIRPVWLEAHDPLSLARADVTPHLDRVDVGLVLDHRGAEPATVEATVDILPAAVTDANLLSPDARDLVVPGGSPIATVATGPIELGPGQPARADVTVDLADATPWRVGEPALYVLRAALRVDGRLVDRIYESFGLRVVSVDPSRPAILLNGTRVFFAGVALHDQRIEPGSVDRRPVGGLPDPETILDQLRRARSVHANLVRTGHTPANPELLRLADRLGFAVWEEIPLYHATPLTFRIALQRGIAQQMLREMALRDMNRPSVLFHGLANEATGEDERREALATLHAVDREIDGTRLTGQAAYGFNPADPTSEPLDVAGYTFYYGVFYGGDPATGTALALEAAHRRYPTKPIMVLEFGRWAAGESGPLLQRRIFEATSRELLARRSTRRGGYVGAAVWWTLDDYFTLRPQLEVEHFGLFAPGGEPRPVAASAAE